MTEQTQNQSSPKSYNPVEVPTVAQTTSAPEAKVVPQAAKPRSTKKLFGYIALAVALLAGAGLVLSSCFGRAPFASAAPTATKTLYVIPFTATPTAVPTKIPPTATLMPSPTATAVPPTSTPTAEPTVVPPTATPTEIPVACTDISADIIQSVVDLQPTDFGQHPTLHLLAKNDSAVGLIYYGWAVSTGKTETPTVDYKGSTYTLHAVSVYVFGGTEKKQKLFETPLVYAITLPDGTYYSGLNSLDHGQEAIEKVVVPFGSLFQYADFPTAPDCTPVDGNPGTLAFCLLGKSAKNFPYQGMDSMIKGIQPAQETVIMASSITFAINPDTREPTFLNAQPVCKP